jgi:hypothetical protein
MRKSDLAAIVTGVVLALSSVLGWTEAGRQDDQRLTAIQTMAEALAACERRHHTHGGTP